MADARFQADLRDIWRALKVYDTSNTFMVHATAFQRVLGELGLSFGDETVDRVMMLCKITDEGYVNFSGIRTAMKEAESGNKPATAATLARGKGIEFQEALAKMVGVSVTAAPPAELADMSQAERARAMASELHELFNSFDNGDIPLDRLREELRVMGFQETSSLRKLLRQATFTFAQLLRALTTVDEVAPEIAAGSSPGQGPTGRKTVVGRQAEAHDVVSWRGAPPSEDHTRRHLFHSDLQNQDTGASLALYGRKIGSSRASDDNFEKATKSPGRSLRMSDSQAAADALFGYGHDVSFETEAQLAARKGIGLSGGPTTSAGHNTAGGLLREQVYSAIRQLDSGSITSAEFRRRIQRLGVPQSHEIDRLLMVYDTNARIDFVAFVKAFEPYFAEHETAAGNDDADEDDMETATVRSRGSRRSVDSGRNATAGYFDRPAGRFEESDVPAATRHHGDVVTWRDTPQFTKEEHKAMIREGLRPGSKKRVDDVVLKNAAGSPAVPDRKPSARGRSDQARRNAGNIVAWAEDESGSPEPVVDTSPRGRHRPRTKAAMKDMCGGVPFGTEADECSMPVRSVTGSRTKFIESRTLVGGKWLEHQDEDGRPISHTPDRLIPPRAAAPWDKDH